jgi:hypothetical protein
MVEDDDDPRDRKFIREMLATWFVAIFVFAVAILLISLHERMPMGPVLPRWYEPPVTGHEAWNQNEPPRPGAHLIIPQSGSSASPRVLPDAAAGQD